MCTKCIKISSSNPLCSITCAQRCLCPTLQAQHRHGIWNLPTMHGMFHRCCLRYSAAARTCFECRLCPVPMRPVWCRHVDGCEAGVVDKLLVRAVGHRDAAAQQHSLRLWQ
jgi:hypothetical protein